MLGIRNTVCNEFPYVELGKPTLTSVVHKRQLVFYNKCFKENDLPMQRYIIRKAMDNNCSFIKHYIELSKQFQTPNEITEKSLKLMQDQIRQKANNNKSKYKTYITINPTLCRPTIYDCYIPTHKLLLITRIRTISHNLEIEKGRQRRYKLPVEQRLCKCGDIEDENHFLRLCDNYIHIRNNYPVLSTLPIYLILDNIQVPEYINDLASCRQIFTNEKL